jgi:hypothetical protein
VLFVARSVPPFTVTPPLNVFAWLTSAAHASLGVMPKFPIAH